jgi:hypothetical protein
MEAAAFSGNWGKFKTFLADNIYYFVGNKTELHSPQAIVDYLIQFLSKELATYNPDFLLAYEDENTVVTELSVKAVRALDNNTSCSLPWINIGLATGRYETGASTQSSPLT